MLTPAPVVQPSWLRVEYGELLPRLAGPLLPEILLDRGLGAQLFVRLGIRLARPRAEPRTPVTERAHGARVARGIRLRVHLSILLQHRRVEPDVGDRLLLEIADHH